MPITTVPAKCVMDVPASANFHHCSALWPTSSLAPMLYGRTVHMILSVVKTYTCSKSESLDVSPEAEGGVSMDASDASGLGASLDALDAAGLGASLDELDAK